MRTAFLLAAAAVIAFGQEAAPPPTMKGVVRKNLVPISKDVLIVKFPRPAVRKLKNGLELLVLENHRVPTVSFSLVIPSSSLSEPKEKLGLADCVAGMLTLGAGSRDARQFSERLAELGGGLGVTMEYGARSTIVTGSALSENLDGLLDLLADVLLRPTFPQDELDKWKTRRLGYLQQVRVDPGFLAQERMHQVLYGGDARQYTAPSTESIRGLTRDDLVGFYKANYRPGGTLIGVAGDVSAAAITAKLEKVLAAWEGTVPPLPKLALEKPISEKKVFLVNRPNSVQTALTLTNRAVGRMDPDYDALQVMNRVLGAGPASRLFRNIREDKGYTYGVGSVVLAQSFKNHFAASSSVRTAVTGPAIDEFLKEFEDIRNRLVPKDELDEAKRAIVAGYALGLENQGNILRQTMLRREYGLPDDYFDTYPAKVMAVTAEDVQRVARKYVPVENLQLIAVGEADKIREIVAKFGPVEETKAP
jgi:predicted Zn-dependent peptidase